MHQNSPCACTVLRKADRAVARFYDAALSDTGMTTNQFALLRHIARAETVALSRLADTMVMDRTSLYRALAPLDRAGWIAFEAARGRTKTVRLTNTGEAAMRAAIPAWETAQARLVEHLGDGQWPAIVTLLGQLTTAAQGASHDR